MSDSRPGVPEPGLTFSMVKGQSAAYAKLPSSRTTPIPLVTFPPKHMYVIFLRYSTTSLPVLSLTSCQLIQLPPPLDPESSRQLRLRPHRPFCSRVERTNSRARTARRVSLRLKEDRG